MANLMQEVDGFSDQQDLEGRERDDLSNQRGSRVCQRGRQAAGCACVRTLRAWSIVKKDGIIDFLREYLSCHRRSVFTFGSDATKNCTRTHKVGRFTFSRVNGKNRVWTGTRGSLALSQQLYGVALCHIHSHCPFISAGLLTGRSEGLLLRARRGAVHF